MDRKTVERKRKRANFQMIEWELRYYQKLRAQLADGREEIVHATVTPDVPVQTGTGDMVLSKVLRLTSTAKLQEAERRIEAIEYALAMTRRQDPARVELVKKKYFENKLTDEGIMEALHISRDTFYRWRRDFVSLVAERLGLEV